MKTCTFVPGFFFVAFGAVVHFHWGRVTVFVFAQTCYIVSPNVPAITGKFVFFIHPGVFGLSDIPVTGFTGHIRTYDMGGMGEKDTIGLLGMVEPGDFDALGHVFINKFNLFRVICLCLFMAVNATVKTGHAGKSAVLPEIVAGFAPIIHFVQMNRMVKVYWLVFFRIEQLREQDPTGK